ncbi:hypothetical protein C8F01DRAFT_157856 [Mycena amicta]|nr:hypothetical protein C8F01DRAFT_157856 [Mycena amicta]
MKFSVSASIAAVAALLASASATPLTPRDVFVPPILYPHAGTVWTVGQRHNVTWDTSDAPVNITNGKGFIMLRKAGLTTPGSSHIRSPPLRVASDTPAVILQNNFNIRLGRIEVTVPWVVDGSDYQLVLFGDSGNFSPNFTIQGSGLAF